MRNTNYTSHIRTEIINTHGMETIGLHGTKYLFVTYYTLVYSKNRFLGLNARKLDATVTRNSVILQLLLSYRKTSLVRNERSYTYAGASFAYN